MAKVSRNEKRLVDTVTGRTLSRHKSGMVAQKKAKQLANKTGHAIKLVDDYGVQFVFQPSGGWEHGKSGRSNPKRSRTTGTTVPAHVRINPRTGRIQVFVTPKVAEKLRGGKGLRVAGATNKRNPVKQYEVKIPPGRLGSYRLGYVAPNAADAKRRALADYNRSLSNEGFPTVKSLPRGTKVIVH